MRQNTFWTVIAIIIIVVGGYFAIKNHLFTTPPAPATTASTTPAVVTSVSYSCDQGKTIGAQFSQSAVALTLSDGRMLNVPQTLSGSGIRYETTATTTDGALADIVFSSEGNDAYLMENASTTYADCLAGTVTVASTTDTFVDQGSTFSVAYPNNPIALSVTSGGGGYTQSWMTDATTSGMILGEINIPQSFEPGTNFLDAKFTIGTSADPSALATCLTYNPTGGKAQATSSAAINSTTYTVFHSSDAGAGNYYDTTSYRVARNSQCYAIEYTIHYGNFANYPKSGKGSVKQFDEAGLKSTLDSIMQSFTFLQ